MYILIDFLVNKFKEHPLTNTIVFGLSQLGDISKTNIYPLVHIIPFNITPGNNYFKLTFEVAVLNRRDSNQKLNNDKIFSDNLIYNLSETAKIIHNTISDIKTLNNNYGISLESDNEAEIIMFGDKNILDGYRIIIDLSIPSLDCY